MRIVLIIFANLKLVDDKSIYILQIVFKRGNTKYSIPKTCNHNQLIMGFRLAMILFNPELAMAFPMAILGVGQNQPIRFARPSVCRFYAHALFL